MSVRILTGRDVVALLPMHECMDAMARTLETTAAGDAENPLRSMLRLPDGSGLLGMMPACLGRSVGIKVVTVMPGNHGSEFDSHQGAVLLFEAEHGCLQAIADASTITAIRTAAVSGVATRLLARPEAKRLAILGSGVQAGAHLAAMRVARDVGPVVVWSPNRENAIRFAEREGEIEVARSARDAVAGADIVCTTTAAKEPVLHGDWIAPGTHVNAVGACLAAYRELDTAAVAGSRLYVDRRESTLAESGDFLIPKREGAIGDDHIVGEIGELLLGRVEGRRSEEEITLFKSLGIGVEDLGAVHHVYEKAIEKGAGVTVSLGGTRDANV